MADDDDQDLDATQNDDADDQDDSDDDADWKPPATKAEFQEMVKKAGNPEAAKWRRRATGKDPNWKPTGAPDKDTTKPPKTTDGDDKLTPDQIRAAAREELQAEFQTKADKDNLRAEVSVALMTAGLNLSEEELASPAKARKAVARVVNMIDLDKLVLDDGNIEGLDDELTELKKSLPGLFKSGAPAKPKTRGGDVAPKNNGGAKGGDDDVAQLAKAWFSGS